MARLATIASAVALLIAACGQATSPASIAPSPNASADSVASASPSPSLAPSVASAPAASPTPHGSLTGGGPLATLVVERMARSPFRARIEIHLTSVTKTDTASADLTATETGAINGQDLDLTIEAVSGGTQLRSRVIVIGDAVYAREKDGPWQLSSRAQIAFAMDAILREVRRTLDAGQLADLGEETLDGRTVHHLTQTAPVTIHDPANGDAVFEAFDLWVLPDGTPVLRRVRTHSSKGSLTASGTSETRYDDFGTAIEIKAPKLPPTPSPSSSTRPARP